MRIYYTIEYHSEMKRWVLWENTKYDRGESFRGIFKGSKKECEEYLRKLKEKKKREELRRKKII